MCYRTDVHSPHQLGLPSAIRISANKWQILSFQQHVCVAQNCLIPWIASSVKLHALPLRDQSKARCIKKPLCAGLTGYGTQICMTFALQNAKAAPAIAMSYLSVVWSLLSGILIFHEIPNWISCVGAALVCRYVLLQTPYITDACCRKLF